MKQEIKIVLGMAFGDCGKGNTVQYLCKQAIAAGKTVAVVRFCGGAQAGHRVVHNGISHVCSSYGSGILLDVPTIYINGLSNTFVDPVALINEYNTLIMEGIEDPGIPDIDWEHMRITTPYDIRAGVSDKKIISDGTCGMGIYSTFKRYHDTLSFHKNRIGEVEDYYGYSNSEMTGVYETAMRKINKLKVSYDIDSYDVLIFEGTQGLLLDMDNGFMPHCTPSKVGLNGIPSKYLTEDTEVYLVTRTYLTRHGNGYEPFGVCMDDYYNIPKEVSNHDDGYQGKFKIGWLDINLLNRAIDRHHLDNYNVKYNLVFTHCDCLVTKNLIPTLDSYGHSISSDLYIIHEDLNLDFKSVLYFKSEEA